MLYKLLQRCETIVLFKQRYLNANKLNYSVHFMGVRMMPEYEDWGYNHSFWKSVTKTQIWLS